MAFSCLAIDPVAPSTLYAGSNGGAFRSRDSGGHWTAVNTGMTGDQVSSLIVDPLTPENVYASRYGGSGAGGWRGGLFRSTDGGDSWTVTGLTDGNIHTLGVDPVTPTTLYAGAGGVHRSTDSGATWTSLNAGLNNQYVVSLAIDPSSPDILYAGTGNGGIFRYASNSSAKATMQLVIGGTTMYAGREAISLEAAPIILNARTLLPIRAVVEAAGGTVTWDAAEQKVTIVRNGTTLTLWIGKNTAEIDGKWVSIDTNPAVVPIISHGRTLLPLRFVAESLGLDVQWDASTKTVTILYGS
jgi:hypothetical protein